MAQGKLKPKAKLPEGAKQKSEKNKVHGLKKGARQIAPKKAHHVEAQKMKKNVEKVINKKIEKEILSRASVQEHTKLTLTHGQSSSS